MLNYSLPHIYILLELLFPSSKLVFRRSSTDLLRFVEQSGYSLAQWLAAEQRPTQRSLSSRNIVFENGTSYATADSQYMVNCIFIKITFEGWDRQ